jgi:photosystem II stability/assembly factor-like uncharacterized protein
MNGGVNWTRSTAGLASITVNALAVSPTDAATPIQYLTVDPTSSSTIYAIAEGVLFKSMNGGVNWTRSTAGLASITVNALAVSPTDAATVYTAAGNDLFKSVDGGAFWTSLFTFRLFDPANAAVPSFFPDGSPTYPVSMLIDSSNPNILYVSSVRGNGCYYADNLLFKSTDGGLTWDDRVSPDRSGCVLGGLFAVSAGLKAIDPKDPNSLYAAEADDEDGGWMLLRTRDGGATWKNFGTFPQNLQAGVWAVAIDPSTPTTLYAGIDDVPVYSDRDDSVSPGAGGVFKSTDDGASWNSVGLSGAAVNRLVGDQ